MFSWLFRNHPRVRYQAEFLKWEYTHRNYKGTDCYGFTRNLDANPKFHRYGNKHTRDNYLEVINKLLTESMFSGFLDGFTVHRSDDYIRCKVRFVDRKGNITHRYISIAYFDVMSLVKSIGPILEGN